MSGTVVIVGASVGGVRTAQALRAEGHAGRIVLIGAEPHPPYDKPPLSKQFLSGAWEHPRLALLSEEEAAAAAIELRLGVAATGLDPAAREVELADGTRVAYDTLVVATGAEARPSPWPAPGVHVLRSLVDGAGLRAALAEDGPVVVVGGGFIGAEVAATAHAAGRAVTIVDPLPAPIARVLGDEVGRLVGEVHRRHGVETRFGTAVRDVTGRAGAFEVTLTDGTVLPAGTVVVGIGAVPAVGWLTGSGLELADGLVCDEYCRATGHPEIFGVGDVARWFHGGHGEHVRVEHWTNAVEQAACVARTITHPAAPVAYRPTEYVWSDQYDWKIQIAGRPQRADGFELAGDPAADPPRFAALYRSSGALSAVVTVNWPKLLVNARRLIAAGTPYEEGLSVLDKLITPVGAA
ncbi:NAD(P)/FAD-dependent oxidoreductase [Amycolatopsis sp. FDAARGOS 1241]|uniref:NAD(P)/FAD-dependent oxidoreductase n=1 Tax=Amycolatopsis sp. FDAARGOS 1241 TaxID=2778070 RepID=UPI001951E829|nr:FAD-dependent oxidoreductase [Amycolatopsis sp. FDAARGOS 1241]QRP49472.1 FAD-dependent oxidoreductase [Amycolatopsis sp. FDAARGOS 1241]